MTNQDPQADLPPSLSIVCSCYNHGRYLKGFLEALAAQTDGRFELIVIDDASTDDSLAVIQAAGDPRIRLVARGVNRGYCASLNEGIQLARADVVAFLASDDLPHPRYVERALAALKSAPSAIAAYVELDRISQDGVSLGEPCRLPSTADRYEILRRSFLGQNQLPSPGMAIRRDLAKAWILPEGTVQYSDWMLQNRILMSGEIVMLEEQLVRYRVSTSSLSARSPASMARDLLETRIMMDDFLKIQDMDFLAQVFPVEMKPYAGLPLRHLPYILGRLALLSDITEKRSWGYEAIMRHLSEPGVAEALQALTGFTHKDLMALAPTEAAGRIEEIRHLRRRTRHLRRWIVALACGFALALWVLCK
jgi:glycosyltransferase involved in cell wall biosynthesis